MEEDIKKKINQVEDYLCDVGLDLEYARDELNRLYDALEEKQNNSIKDINNFKRELKKDGLYSEKPEEFIEQYMIYYNKQRKDKNMRNIKFRGKDRENWHYGDLVKEIRHHDNKLFDGVITHIKNYEYNNGTYVGDMFPVNPETVGQYTGLNDKNGKEIYEGDIVYIIPENETGVVEWENEIARYVVIYDNIITDFDNWYGKDLEIIGNIYDNPELLEEGE